MKRKLTGPVTQIDIWRNDGLTELQIATKVAKEGTDADLNAHEADMIERQRRGAPISEADIAIIGVEAHRRIGRRTDP